jgi:hypothetical protein
MSSLPLDPPFLEGGQRRLTGQRVTLDRVTAHPHLVDRALGEPSRVVARKVQQLSVSATGSYVTPH